MGGGVDEATSLVDLYRPEAVGLLGIRGCLWRLFCRRIRPMLDDMHFSAAPC